ncbi:uncharacterized protein N7506_001119 [Penicillium brevicompactum]|uniref:uncharacterized protein n=1 Tax=Penicillium brevicompactum TaxID=5074 RepID=UPI0025425C07|nr:uncharacterized protein N7506_001119 [Penicillium brevicompactum]KAJ5347866.1 hypothetical protein N7506_001119 [Penicillium brevicompactum]
MGLEKRRVDKLVSEKQLWVIAIVLEPGASRFGPGLFNKSRIYGDQTTTVHKIRDKLYQEQCLHFVVRASDLQSVVEDFQKECKKSSKSPLAQFFPRHPRQPFLQERDYASAGKRPYVKPEVNYGFRNWFYYNTFVGYGTIIEHENELKRVENGQLFEAKIQVFAVSREDSSTYMACMMIPDWIEGLRVGSTVHIRWQPSDLTASVAETDAQNDEDFMTLEQLETMNRWTGEVIEPLPAARKDTISLIIHRPSKETPGARQPKLASNLRNAPFEKVMVKISVSCQPFNRFLACNRDLQHWSNTEVCREFLGGDLMALPQVDLLGDIDKDLIEEKFAQGRVNPDIRKIMDELPNARGRFFNITGPAGSGKSYVMVILSLLMLKGSKMFYPVHPDGATGDWMETFHESEKGTRVVRKEPERILHKPQVVLSCPTNFLASENCVKIQRAADDLFTGEPIMIIRVHPRELELLIAKQSYTRREQYPRVAKPEHDQEVEEDMSAEGLIKILKEVLEHYRRCLPSITSVTPGINDNRLQLMGHSLGHRMLQVCGIIPGCPWAVSGGYPKFVDYHLAMLEGERKLNDKDELAFETDMKRLARDTMAKADIVVGTPFVLGTPLMCHGLHPTVVFIDDAGMSKEADLLPLITYYFPKAFGLFGDPKQLQPTILSTTAENPFREQISVSLLSRMISNGCGTFTLDHQHRLTGQIHHFTNRLFYRNEVSSQNAKHLDPLEWASKIKEHNFRKYNVNSNVVFLNLPRSQETSVKNSWANRAHVVVGLDIVYDLVSDHTIPIADIVILVGYDAQKREYLAEISRRVDSRREFEWLDIRICVIETFQGNQAPFVIFDLVRSDTLGHMRSAHRLNVGMTRGSFGLWCLYNENAMKNRHVDRSALVVRGDVSPG